MWSLSWPRQLSPMSASINAPYSDLRAPAIPAAIPAPVARSAAGHNRAALFARRRICFNVPQSAHREVGGRRSHDLGPDARWGRRRPREKLQSQPASDVIHNRLGVTDLFDTRPSARLETGVAELVAKDLERHAVLQREGNGDSEGVHESRNRRACLCHADEDFTRLAVLVHSDHQIAFVPAH